MISNRPLFYLEGRRTRRSRGRAPWVLLAALLVLLAGAYFLRAPLSELLWKLGAPLMRARHAPALSMPDYQDRDALYAENVELKRMLGRTVEFERVLAAVLLRPPATPYDTLVLDAGAEQGVEVGDAIAAGGAVLGRVSQVSARSSRATLYSAPGEEYEALVRHGASTLAVVLRGQGGGSLSAEVPAGAGVVAGDEAVIAGLATAVVARVAAVERGTSESISTLYFQLPLNVSSLQFVEVWKLPHDAD